MAETSPGSVKTPNSIVNVSPFCRASGEPYIQTLPTSPSLTSCFLPRTPLTIVQGLHPPLLLSYQAFRDYPSSTTQSFETNFHPNSRPQLLETLSTESHFSRAATSSYWLSESWIPPGTQKPSEDSQARWESAGLTVAESHPLLIDVSRGKVK